MDYDLLIRNSRVVDGWRTLELEKVTATKRLIQRSEGVHYTIVNGKVIYDDGKLSGEMAGNVLRSAAYAGQ